MIFTSSYDKCNTKDYKTYSISKDKGVDANYNGDYFLDLAPKESFFRIWKNNRGIVPFDENTKYYVNEFYNQILKNLDPKEVYQKLDNSILLCYENNLDFCHRHLVAAWFELLLGVEVFEVVVNGLEYEIVDKPSYIKDYLKEVMDKDDVNYFEKGKVNSKS